LTQTHQPVRITDPKPPADLNIVMDPQPFPRRFLGNIRSTTRIICNQGQWIETSQLPLWDLPQTRGLRHETQLQLTFPGW